MSVIPPEINFSRQERLSSEIRPEEEIKKGNRLIVIRRDGTAEEVESWPKMVVKFVGDCSLIVFHEDIRIDKDLLITSSTGCFTYLGKDIRLYKRLLLDLKCAGFTFYLGDGARLRSTSVFGAGEPNLEVLIGKEFMSALELIIRPSDGHTIYKIDNPAVPTNEPLFGVHIGNHVWTGQRVMITKDSCIPDNSIVAAGAIVGRKKFPPNSIIGGVPAKLISKGTSWSETHIYQWKEQHPVIEEEKPAVEVPLLERREKIAKYFRDEAEIAKGKRIILVASDGTEREVESVPNCTIRFRGETGLVKIHEPLKGKGKVTLEVGERGYIEIGEKCTVRQKLVVGLLGHDGTVVLGKNIDIHEMTLYCSSEKEVEVIIGDGLIASWNINLRPVDGHVIFDLDTKRPVNDFSFGIHVGNHVWFGHDAFILKDACVPSDCIVGARAMVGHKQYPSHSILAGSPAKAVRQNVSWDKKSIEMYEKQYAEEKEFLESVESRS